MNRTSPAATTDEPIADDFDEAETELDEEPATERRRSGPRLNATQRAEIVAALERGESGPALAERYGVSVGAIYSYRRKAGAFSGEPQAKPESDLRVRLVNFAVRTLLGQKVPEAEHAELEHEVREELLKRLAAGI